MSRESCLKVWHAWVVTRSLLFSVTSSRWKNGALIDFEAKRQRAGRLNDSPSLNFTALGQLGTSQANALIQEVKRRSDLALAAHCDVVLRLANRKSDVPDHDGAELKSVSNTVEDANVGQHRMGDAVLFTLEELGFERLVETETAPPDDIHPVRPTSPPKGAAPLNVEAPPRLSGSRRPLSPSRLGANALLNETDILSPWDRIKLGANPSTLRSDRFELRDIDIVITGVQVDSTSQRSSEPSLPPLRVVERSKAPLDQRAAGAQVKAYRTLVGAREHG